MIRIYRDIVGWIDTSCLRRNNWAMLAYGESTLEAIQSCLLFSLVISLRPLMLLSWGIKLCLSVIHSCSTTSINWGFRERSFSPDLFLLLYHLVSVIDSFSVDEGKIEARTYRADYGPVPLRHPHGCMKLILWALAAAMHVVILAITTLWSLLREDSGSKLLILKVDLLGRLVLRSELPWCCDLWPLIKNDWANSIHVISRLLSMNGELIVMWRIAFNWLIQLFLRQLVIHINRDVGQIHVWGGWAALWDSPSLGQGRDILISTREVRGSVVVPHQCRLKPCYVVHDCYLISVLF